MTDDNLLRYLSSRDIRVLIFAGRPTPLFEEEISNRRLFLLQTCRALAALVNRDAMHRPSNHTYLSDRT